MDSKKPIVLTIEIVKFLKEFEAAFVADKNLKRDNDKTVGTALIYEKIRVALEYQEEHLIFKNAISRILRRKYMLNPGIESKQLVQDLINELSWANYVNPEKIDPLDMERIQRAADRYLVILKYARSGRFKRPDLIKMVLDWLACEIDEVFIPATENQLLIDYVHSIIRQNLNLKGVKIGDDESEIQLKSAINTLLLKPDYPLIQFWTLKLVYPDWSTMDLETLKKMSRSFDPYYNKLDHALNHPLRKNYLSFAKRYIAPFILLRSVLVSQKLDIDKIIDKPALLFNHLMEEYDELVQKGREKVWRATMRALFFILITKISLAFILEMPFDRILTGRVDYLSLVINVTLPPLLMFAAGTFIKSPPKKNYINVASSIIGIITNNQIENKPFLLVKPKKPSSFLIFNTAYSLFTLGVLGLVIWLLVYLNFNFVSILLFFFFISVVSFFSFRIRNIALELAMKRSRDDTLTSVVELIFLPFIRIGRTVSDRFAAFNPAILFLDFLIEAPLKTIIKILNSWFRFINTKKEELEF